MSGAGLELGVAELGLALSQKQVADLNAFLQELERWNRVHNLTSVEGEQASIDLHLIDSIAILPIMREFLPPTQVRIADLGSGGGLPAIRNHGSTVKTTINDQATTNRDVQKLPRTSRGESHRLLPSQFNVERTLSSN